MAGPEGKNLDNARRGNQDVLRPYILGHQASLRPELRLTGRQIDRQEGREKEPRETLPCHYAAASHAILGSTPSFPVPRIS